MTPLDHSFDRLTHLEGEGGKLEITFDPATVLWSVNGGFAAAVVLRAVERMSAMPRPLSMTCNFLRPMKPVPSRVESQAVQRSLRTEMIETSVWQGRLRCMTAHTWVGLPSGGADYDFAPMPDVTRPAEQDADRAFDVAPPLAEVIEQRSARGRGVERGVAPDDRALRWFRYRPDPVSHSPYASFARAVPIVDTLWLAAARLRDPSFLSDGAAPTLQLSLHFFEPEERDGWMLAEARSDFAARGLIHGSARVWSAAGRPMAHGMVQMLCAPGSRGLDAGKARNRHGG